MIAEGAMRVRLGAEHRFLVKRGGENAAHAFGRIALPHKARRRRRVWCSRWLRIGWIGAAAVSKRNETASIEINYCACFRPRHFAFLTERR